MNYMPPPSGLPGLGPGEQHPGNDMQPGMDEPQAKQAEEALQELLGGELPGEGIWFPEGAASRQPIIGTNPERVREWLLRAIEAVALSATMPFGEITPEQAATAALRFSQAYLLLDPTVDESGVPVGEKAALAAEGQIAGAHGQAAAQTQSQIAINAHQASITPPPRVQPNAGERKVAEKNEGKTKSLRSARGQTPRPQPRVGS